MTQTIKIQKVATFNSDRKNSILFQTNHSDITKIVIDYFSTHSYIVNISYYFLVLFKNISLVSLLVLIATNLVSLDL